MEKAKSNVLVAYFSHSGKTRAIAEMIHVSVGGDVFEIVNVDPYPSAYEETAERASKELKASSRPTLKGRLDDASSFDLVFVGYPNWWGTMPTPVMTFLTEYGFPGKAIAPFCTNEGSGLGLSIEDIARLCPRSRVLEGLAVRGRSAKGSRGDVASWLRRLGF